MDIGQVDYAPSMHKEDAMKRVTGQMFFPATTRFEKAYKVPCKLSRRKLHYAAVAASPENGPMRRAVMDIARVHVLEAELVQYRAMLEKMVMQQSAQLNRRIAILKSCNEKLSAELVRVRGIHADLQCRRTKLEHALPEHRLVAPAQHNGRALAS